MDQAKPIALCHLMIENMCECVTYSGIFVSKAERVRCRKLCVPILRLPFILFAEDGNT